jgi:hypothetical protein
VLAAGTVELASADRALWALLGDEEGPVAALVGANVYPHVAPPELEPQPAGSTIPAGCFAVWTLITPLPDVRALGTGPAPRLLVAAEYAIKAVGPVSAPLELEPLAAALDAVLAGATLTDDGQTWTVARLSPILYPEAVPGAPLHWHLGGLFRLEAG